MWYHFKGVLKAEDYKKLLAQQLIIMQLVTIVLVMIVALGSGILQKNLGLGLSVGVIVSLISFFYLKANFFKKMLKNFKETPIDQHITKESLEAQVALRKAMVTSDTVYLFQGKNQVLLFKKEMLEDQTQWESFVKMVQELPVKGKK